MNRLLLGFVALAATMSAPAFAADLPVKARPMAVDPAYNWSGVYIGAGTGGTWYEANRFMPDLPLVGIPPTLFTAHANDWIYNVHGGVQQQWGRWVFGVEAAYNGSRNNMRSDVSVSPPEPFSKFNATVFITDLFTIGPRIGYTWDRLMVYGTGGYAGANIDGRYTCTFGGQFIFPGRAPCNFPLFGTLADLNLSGTTWNNGWFAGAGFDYVVFKGSFADVLLGAEYQHFDLERKQAVACTPALCPGVQHQSFLHDANGDIARIRLTIKSHGWGMN
jgi:outer membrane immunogenic protein